MYENQDVEVYGASSHHHINHPSSQIQIWMKLRPISNYQTSALEIYPDGKTLQLHPLEESLPTKPIMFSTKPSTNVRTFVSDGILQNASHEETFSLIVENIIEKAMNGISGVLLSLGTEGSGKTFTFYGDGDKYESRGIVPRSLDKIFKIIESRIKDIKYKVLMSMIQIWKDKIHDLIALTPDEIKTVGDSGPNGMVQEQIKSSEHGLALLMRGFAGQRYLSRDSKYIKCHTIVYLDITGEQLVENQQGLIKFSSRITFAKIASIPQREKDSITLPIPIKEQTEKVIQSDDCFYIIPATPPAQSTNKKYFGNRSTIGDIALSAHGERQSCCAIKSGYFGETISIRRDLLFLEQMFMRVRELQKLHQYYHKLSFLGMEKIMRKPKMSPSQYFRQSKLCHCLRDLVNSQNEIRIILHLRPEFKYLPTVLEALRFADRLRSITPTTKFKRGYIPGKNTANIGSLNILRNEIKILREELGRLSNKATEDLRDDSIELSTTQIQNLQNKATDYFEGKIEDLEVGTKSEAKALFQNFRRMFNTLATQTADHDGKIIEHGKEKNIFMKRKTKASNSSLGKDVTGEDKDKIKGKKLNPKLKVKKVKSKRYMSGKDDKKEGITGENSNENIIKKSSFDLEEDEEKDDDIKNNLQNPHHIQEGREKQSRASGLIFSRKIEAQEEFASSEIGINTLRELNLIEKRFQLKKIEYEECIQKLSEFNNEISIKQIEFDKFGQDRHLKGDEYDISGNVILQKQEKDLVIELRTIKDSRDRTLDILKDMKLQLLKERKGLDAAKAEYESSFQNFCLSRYSTDYDEGVEVEPIHKNQSLDTTNQFQTEKHPFFNFFTFDTTILDQDMPNNFENLKRTAQEQAKAILTYYRNRPPWRNY